MASIINSTTTSPGGLISTGDSSNSLLIQTGDTTAITINGSQVVSLTNPLPVASGGTGNTTNAAASVATTNWTITESGGKLIFSYSGTAKGSLDSSGNFIVTGNVTAYGTP